MARLAHKCVNPTMRTESPTATAHRFVDLDVVDAERISVKAADFGVALRILQKPKHEDARLLRPPPHRHFPVAALRLAFHPDLEPLEGHDLPLLHHCLEILLRTLQSHPLDRCPNLMRVLEMHTEIAAARFHGCRENINIMEERKRLVPGTLIS